MNDSTSDFFQTVAAHRHEPLLGKATGTVRFDLSHDGYTEHWLVTISEGDVTVTPSETGREADAVFHAGRDLFDRAVTGRTSAFAAVLRGAATIEGDVALLLLVFRLLPGPVSPEQRRRTADASGGHDERCHRQGSRRQHLRGQRCQRRLRGIADGCDWALLVRHTIPVSKWVLTVNGQRLGALSVDSLQYFETRFFLVPGTGTIYVVAKLMVIRQRAAGNGFHEELTILNHGSVYVALYAEWYVPLRQRTAGTEANSIVSVSWGFKLTLLPVRG